MKSIHLLVCIKIFTLKYIFLGMLLKYVFDFVSKVNHENAKMICSGKNAVNSAKIIRSYKKKKSLTFRETPCTYSTRVKVPDFFAKSFEFPLNN